ncbi:MAG: hypothetical protein HXS53_08740 [Theionarchaea archaeon]|nr:hypothetical protein [Theionarchaea archaeon]
MSQNKDGKLKIFVIMLTFSFIVNFFQIYAGTDNELTISNTIIISNKTDELFCRDFSPFLKRISLDWIAIESPELPETLKHKNVIIIGGPDAEYTGKMVINLLEEKEAQYLREDGNSLVLKKENPWDDSRTTYILAGSDRTGTKRAAEEGIRSIMEEASDQSTWVRSPISVKSAREIREYIAQFQFIPQTEELTNEDLAFDVHATDYKDVTRDEAREDVEYLFYLISHGYSGYEFFKQRGDFDQANRGILERLEDQPLWSPREFSDLIHEHLSFISDGHFCVGFHYYYEHEDFWHNGDVELQMIQGDYYLTSDHMTWKVHSVNGESPPDYIFPSLNCEGEPVYIFGVLSKSLPEPLQIIATKGTEQRTFEIGLGCSDFSSGDLFLEENHDGIPVIAVRSFYDLYHIELEQFLKTAFMYKGGEYLILDIRGNGGGMSHWPEEWVKEFSGKSLGYFTNTKLGNRTTIMGRVNSIMFFRENLSDPTYLEYSVRYYEKLLSDLDQGRQAPTWTPLEIPRIQSVSNTTTVILLTDKITASAGEVLIGYLRQLDNIIIVGENSAGVCTFWSKLPYRLPNSNLPVALSPSLNFPADLEFIEERGMFPDLWVPSGCALEYALKAIKKGNIASTGEQNSIHDLLRKGFKMKEEGNVEEAFRDLAEAHSRLREAEFAYSDRVYNTGDGHLIYSDLEREIVFLCLHFIKVADYALEERRYEDALSDLALINQYWRSLYSFLPLYSESEEYKEEFSQIEDTCSPGIVEQRIRTSIESMMMEASELTEHGLLEESMETYMFMKDRLAEAGWLNENDMAELESRISSLESALAHREEQNILIVVILLTSLIPVSGLMYIRFKKKSSNSNRSFDKKKKNKD